MSEATANQAAWVAAATARIRRRPFVSSRTAYRLLAEAAGFRLAALTAYVSHREMRMDTVEEEQLRLKLLARFRDLLGITADDGWQDTGLSPLTTIVAARDTAAGEQGWTQADRDHWEEQVQRAAFEMHRRQVKAAETEAARLRALLEQHGIDPGEGGQR